MNETLEAMARALFKSWFVDFDPVRAKFEGRGPALPKPLADLFPDPFVDSKLGEIPKGWSSNPSARSRCYGWDTPSTERESLLGRRDTCMGHAERLIWAFCSRSSRHRTPNYRRGVSAD